MDPYHKINSAPKARSFFALLKSLFCSASHPNTLRRREREAMDYSYSNYNLLLFVLLLSLTFLFAIPSRATHETTLKGIDLANPVLDVTPSPISGHLSGHGSKDGLFCERVKVSGHSRLKLGSYTSSFHITLAPSVKIPERLHGKIQVFFHRNASIGPCHCEKDEWKTLQKGLWHAVMSPYEERYVDVKFIGEISGSVTVTVEEDPQQWRLLCLATGFILLLLAPVVSSWVPFYYSTSMAIGVFLVIIILLFQGMKLLPTGRKNVFYLSLCGSVLGAGTFVLHQISMVVNSILVNFGLNEEMHNPVYIFLLVGIVLAGAALGYWIVRKFVISKDGSVDVGIAQFVKWAMRIIATTFIFQSTLDTPLAMVALASSCAICSFLTKLKQHHPVHQSYSKGGSPWRQHVGTAKHNHAEFLSRSAKVSPEGKMWNSPKSTPAWSNSPVKGPFMISDISNAFGTSRMALGLAWYDMLFLALTGLVSPSAHLGIIDQKDYYSTFHKNLRRKKFSEKEWEDFTRESTQQAVAEWAASPEVTSWIIENADRIQLLPSDYSSEEAVGSESDSTDEILVGSGKRFSLFNW